MLLPVLRIQDVYPGSGFFPIPDSGSNKQRAGKNKIVVLPFLVENYLHFCTGTENDLSQLTQNLIIFNPKYC
jgi:hypothetical protein